MSYVLSGLNVRCCVSGRVRPPLPAGPRILVPVCVQPVDASLRHTSPSASRYMSPVWPSVEAGGAALPVYHWLAVAPSVRKLTSSSALLLTLPVLPPSIYATESVTYVPESVGVARRS